MLHVLEWMMLWTLWKKTRFYDIFHNLFMNSKKNKAKTQSVRKIHSSTKTISNLFYCEIPIAETLWKLQPSTFCREMELLHFNFHSYFQCVLHFLIHWNREQKNMIYIWRKQNFEWLDNNVLMHHEN